MPTSPASTSERLSSRIGATALVAATSAAALLALDGTAAAATSAHMVMGYAPDKVAIGDSVNFRGKLMAASGNPLGSKVVYLQRNNGGQWWDIGSRRTYSSGRVNAVIKIKNTASYRWVYRGSPAYGADTSGTEKVTATNPINDRIVRWAAAQKGDPYRYGATGPNAFDCSGLTQYVHKQVGISLPRTSRDQAAKVRRISTSSRKPGDLIFMHSGGRVYHAAIYAGSGYMWTAPQSGETVKKAKIYSSSYYVGRAW